MARFTSRHSGVRSRIRTDTPGLIVSPLRYWSPSSGVNYLSPTNRLSLSEAAEVLNMRLRAGSWKSRPGTVLVGANTPSSAGNTMAVLKFIDITGVGHLIAFTTTVVLELRGTAWTAIPDGPALTGTTSDPFAWTVFGNTLIFSNGVDGLFELSFTTGVITLITEGPSAKWLTTFDGRVIAANVRDPHRSPSRLRWSAKNDSFAWEDEDIGSGFDDLLSTPGGIVDHQYGIYPITDFTALAVRSQTIWQIEQTENVDAPFRFSRLYDDLGTDAPHSVTSVPGGIAGVFRDDVYLVSPTSREALGGKIFRRLVSDVDNLALCRSVYDTTVPDEHTPRGILRISAPQGSETVVYEYSFVDKEWSRSIYPWVIRWMHHTRSALSPLAIDELTGTINDLSGTIDDLMGASDGVAGMLFATSGIVTRESTAVSVDALTTSTTQAVPISLATGFVQAGSSLKKTRVIELQLEYEAGASQTLVFEYSTNGGTTWTTFSSVDVTTTSAPSILSVRKTVERFNMQLRVRSTALGQLRVIAFNVFACEGAMEKH